MPRTPKPTPTKKPAKKLDAALAAPPTGPAQGPLIYDPESGKKALAALAPRLAAMTEADVVTARAQIPTAALAALAIAGFALSPELYPRFARLPAEEFALAHLTDLPELAFATIYAFGEAAAAGAIATDAELPAELVARAAAIEARMQTVCEYHFLDDPELGPEVRRLSPGHGHLDTATDLLGYARLYELRPDVVAADPTHYRPTDLADARAVAGQILAGLTAAMTPKAREAYDRLVRVWSLLVRASDEVRATGLWLLRHDPRRFERLPSLFAAGRPGVGKRKVKGKDEAARAPEKAAAPTPAPPPAPAPAPTPAPSPAPTGG